MKKDGLINMAANSKKFFTAVACLLFVFSAAMGFLLNEIYEGHYNLPEQEFSLRIVSRRNRGSFVGKNATSFVNCMS